MSFVTVRFYSEVLGLHMQAEVLLPGCVNAKELQPSYPTLYLLHGMSDDQTIWMRYTSVKRYAFEKNLAIVMPTTHLGWYVDTEYGMRYEQYIAEELPALMRCMFRGMSEKREDTFIAGLSMGGYGAFHLAFAHPETFGAAASLSGAMDPEEIIQRRSEMGENYWSGVFGPVNRIAGSHVDLFAQAEKCKAGGILPRLYQWCGTEDGAVRVERGRDLRDHLLKLGYDLSYSESKGDHSWPCWDQGIQDIFRWIEGFHSLSWPYHDAG